MLATTTFCSDPRMGDIPEETIRKARLSVCANATDADEAAYLLQMLGLV